MRQKFKLQIKHNYHKNKITGKIHFKKILVFKEQI